MLLPSSGPQFCRTRRRRWIAAIKETERQRKMAMGPRPADKVARGASGEVVAVFRPRGKIPVAAPHGKPKDCNFDPAQRKAALIRRAQKPEPEIPLDKMSKRHRRQVKIAAQARAPFQNS